MKSEIYPLVDFSYIRYSVVWEDINLLYQALSLTPADDVLSVTSAGCNVLGLLLKQPSSITAIDINGTQNALLELKMAGIQFLDYLDFIGFIGVRPYKNRLQLYKSIRSNLSPGSKAYWDSNQALIEEGIIYTGKLERYFKVWQQEHLAAIHPPERTAQLLSMNCLAEQQEFFETVWATPAFVENFKNYFGNYNLQKGRDPALFKYVQIDAGTHFYNRFKYVCTEIPLLGNYYVEFFLTSQYRDLNLVHPYLREENYLLLRSQLHKVYPVYSDLESFLADAVPGRFSKANFSNLFEYMSEDNAHDLLKLVHQNFRKGGLIAYWNLLVPRSRSESLQSKFLSHAATGRNLWQMDRSWFYRDFIVEEIN